MIISSQKIITERIKIARPDNPSREIRTAKPPLFSVTNLIRLPGGFKMPVLVLMLLTNLSCWLISRQSGLRDFNQKYLNYRLKVKLNGKKFYRIACQQ